MELHSGRLTGVAVRIGLRRSGLKKKPRSIGAMKSSTRLCQAILGFIRNVLKRHGQGFYAWC